MGCHAPEVLELVEAAFDQMPFLVDVFVERQFLGPRRMRGDDGLGVDGPDVGAEVVGVEGGIVCVPKIRFCLDAGNERSKLAT
jgi:hypothetical protein